ncbi:MAG: Hdr-like menaquinol oxidoreductase cytochrome c subunit [Pseudomonadota bacterium]
MKLLRIPVAMLLALLLAAPLSTFAGAPKPAISIANPGQCIAPAEEMRRNHMEMLKHQRDRTLRQGIRGEKASLNECINCHASKTTGSVLGESGFCQECHSYAAVKLDCWDCHQPKAGHPVAGAVGAKQ